MTVTVAICTGMGMDLTALLGSITDSDVDEILIVGTEGRDFMPCAFFNDPRIKMFRTRHFQSYKRRKALEECTSDILAFIDDDAVASPQWVACLRAAFADPAVGIVTGPSLLSPSASTWKRTAQLAMSSSQYSRRRYFPSRAGFVEWFDIIGANMAFRRVALEEVGIETEAFPSHGEEMILSFKVVEKGWRIRYEPDMYVYHEPHGFFRQIRQIHHWGRAEVRLKRAGVLYPKRDPAFFFYIPTLVIFALAYVYGEGREWLFRDRDIRLKMRWRAKWDAWRASGRMKKGGAA